VIKGSFIRGEEDLLEIDKDKRKGVARNHTATHLLQYALRQVLGNHVKQSGSHVDKDRLRFDFTHFQGMTDEELSQVENVVNEKVMECANVSTDVKSREEAIREGATALFEEKYGDTVRVVRISDFSSELCGGTHVKNTGEIGSFSILSESSLASGVRRIEAVTGEAAVNLSRERKLTINNLARLSNTEPAKILERVEGVIEELKEREKEIERLKEVITTYRVDEAIQSAHEKAGARIISMYVERASADDLRKITDIIRGKTESFVAVVGTKVGGKGLLVAAVSKDMQVKYSAGKIVKGITEKYNGKGGGGPNVAQGGVPAENLLEAIKDVEAVLGGGK
jgi:alanyl-tRNA synthetase